MSRGPRTKFTGPIGKLHLKTKKKKKKLAPKGSTTQKINAQTIKGSRLNLKCGY